MLGWLATLALSAVPVTRPTVCMRSSQSNVYKRRGKDDARTRSDRTASHSKISVRLARYVRSLIKNQNGQALAYEWLKTSLTATECQVAKENLSQFRSSNPRAHK